MTFRTHRVRVTFRRPETFPVELIYPNLAYECRMCLALNLIFGDSDACNECGAICVTHVEPFATPAMDSNLVACE
ncbi:hypothetical protein QR680_000227 [Steinernema hermaphroditum]|uniref:Uncharacterized protein n=1 Tax=Steinernema hermaphroditum TaxID=289476 RepID=A0AA39LD92_9BILA|nr:hypothetical protein QR680_000227 [Steinernema hermaphroditum]